MKKIVVILSLLLLIGFADRIWSTANLQTTNWLHEPLICLDSALGLPATPDSAHVHVFYGNADSSCYSARITTIPSSWIDRIVYAGATPPSFFFMDQVADIDADSGAGLYTVNVQLWKNNKPTDNIFDFCLATQAGQREIWVSRYGSESNTGLSPDDAKFTLRGGLRGCDALNPGESGCIVHVLAGSYPDSCCSTVTIDSVNIVFEGAGIGRTILDNVGNTNIFTVNKAGYAGTEISGLTLLGNTYGKGVYLQAGNNCYIHDNKIINFSMGISVDAGSDNHIIRRNKIEKCANDGIMLGGDWCLLEWNIVDSLTSSTADAIAISGVQHGTIINNYIHTETGYGIHCILYTATVPKGVFIANNYVDTRTLAKAFPEEYASHNFYVGNHGRSERWEEDTTSTIQEDIYYSPRSTNSDSGWTATRAGYLDVAVSHARDSAHVANTNVLLVKAKTDNLPDDPADDSDIDAQLEAIGVYLGAKADGYYKILYPADGSANKDSVRIFDSGDACKGTIIFHHSNTDAVIDSVTYEKY